MPPLDRRAARAKLPHAPEALTTSALCAAAGVTRGVLRLYEREGLIPLPQRNASGYRKYPADEVLRLQAIRQLKEIGFTLKEIALLLEEQDNDELDAARLCELAAEQLGVIDARIARLEMVRGYMAAVAAGNAALINDPECNFLIDFLSAGQVEDRVPNAPGSKRLHGSPGVVVSRISASHRKE